MPKCKNERLQWNTALKQATDVECSMGASRTCTDIHSHIHMYTRTHIVMYTPTDIHIWHIIFYNNTHVCLCHILARRSTRNALSTDGRCIDTDFMFLPSDRDRETETRHTRRKSPVSSQAATCASSLGRNWCGRLCFEYTSTSVHFLVYDGLRATNDIRALVICYVGGITKQCITKITNASTKQDYHRLRRNVFCSKTRLPMPPQNRLPMPIKINKDLIKRDYQWHHITNVFTQKDYQWIQIALQRLPRSVHPFVMIYHSLDSPPFLMSASVFSGS